MGINQGECWQILLDKPLLEITSHKSKCREMKIAQVFKEYYESLYQLKRKSTSVNAQNKWEAAREYIKETEMPKLTEEIARECDVPITIEEFYEGIKITENG